MPSHSILMDHQNYNHQTKRWRLEILEVPFTKLERITRNGESIDAGKFKIDGSMIQFYDDISLSDDEVLYAYIQTQASKNKKVLGSSFAVAIIGLLGTFLQLIYPDLRCHLLSCNGTLNDMGHFRISQHIHDDKAGSSSFIFSHEKKSGSIVREKDLKSGNLWIAIRGNTNISPKHFKFDNVHGPYSFSSGNPTSIYWKNGVRDDICKFRYLEAIILLSGERMTHLKAPFRVIDLGEAIRPIALVGAKMECD